MLRLYSSLAAPHKEPLKPFVSETSDHAKMVTRYVTGYKSPNAAVYGRNARVSAASEALRPSRPACYTSWLVFPKLSTNTLINLLVLLE